jgi:hypothetical protein
MENRDRRMMNGSDVKEWRSVRMRGGTDVSARPEPAVPVRLS